ncbi:MAG: NeuD/PglB/VioB family sugar acetyltransferase [Dysgonamonadaceae bacterium]|jgi:acetyltransferase EpsM|nr:NeuD/PglB/VioB family sugar acetyltransferase [Dysgonamonadaceae bacterium]
MKKLVILGGSGIGMIACSIANDLGYYEICGFLNDIVPIGNEIGKYKKIPVIGKTEDVKKYLLDADIQFFIAYIGMQNEEEVFNKIQSLNIPAERFATLIHPSAVVPKGLCKIGNGVMMSPLSQLSSDTTIEDNCILLPNSYVGHDSTLRHFAHIAANAVVGANVDVGRAVHIGTNATIREKVKIGDFSLIGSGAVVLDDVAPNSIVVGNPARLLHSKDK